MSVAGTGCSVRRALGDQVTLWGRGYKGRIGRGALAAAVAALAVVCLALPLGAAAESLRNLAAGRLLIGTAVDENDLRHWNVFSGDSYRATLAREFNLITPETWLKMNRVHPRHQSNNLSDFNDQSDYDFSRLDELAEFARTRYMKMRGQPLVWHKNLPDWLTDGLDQGRFSRADLLVIFEDHIRTVVRHGASLRDADGGKLIVSWDVINEPTDGYGRIRDDSFWAVIGGGGADDQANKREFIRLAYQWARSEDPEALLFLNECGAEDLSTFSNAVYDIVRQLKQEGAQIDGYGLQTHLAVDLAEDIDRFCLEMAANMDRYAALGLKLQISEMEVRFQEAYGWESEQALVFGRVLEIALANPNVVAFMVWGLTDNHTFLDSCIPGLTCTSKYYNRADYPGPLLFDGFYNAKQAYHALNYVLGR